VARRYVPAAVLADVQALYRSALTRLRKSAILNVFAARFFGTYAGNRHLQMSQQSGEYFCPRRKQKALHLPLVQSLQKTDREREGLVRSCRPSPEWCNHFCADAAHIICPGCHFEEQQFDAHIAEATDLAANIFGPAHAAAQCCG
jgi:hypothetical protein